MPSMTTKSSVEKKVNEVDCQKLSAGIIDNWGTLHVLLNSFFLNETKSPCVTNNLFHIHSASSIKFVSLLVFMFC